MIKFRAWDNDRGLYLYNIQDACDMIGGFVKYENGENARYFEECFGDFLDNKQYLVEQFTGLKDTNGKEIYEGDIVEIVSQYWGQLGNRYEVKFERGSFTVKHSLLYEIRPSVSVIGNVHEDPELLEEGK